MKFTKIINKILVYTLRSTGIVAASAAFPGCFYGAYGGPPGGYSDRIQGKVLSESTNLPIPNIKVSVNNVDVSEAYTSYDGSFYFRVYEE